jgi:hypothetical protein
VRVRVDPEVVQYVAVAAGGVALLGLLVGLGALRSATRTRRLVRALAAAPGAGTSSDAALLARLRRGLCHVGLVRYDALAEMGGRLSFSVALLDEDANGVVISAINGRTESRCYGKLLANGAAEQELSPEEKEAIARALG